MLGESAQQRYSHLNSCLTHPFLASQKLCCAYFSFAKILLLPILASQKFASLILAPQKLALLVFRLPFRRDSGQYLEAGSQQNSNSKSSLHFSFYAATGGASAICCLLRGRVLGFAVILGAGCHRSESVIQPTDVRARVLLFRVGMAAIRHVPPLKLLPPVRVCPIPQEWGSCRLLLAFQAACTINSTAFCTWISVLSSRGTGVSPCCTSRPISVQPRMTACAPRSAKVAMAFR